jgi:two-component system sensor histidine kinase RpfC
MNGLIPLVRSRFTNRPDSEHEQAFVRLVIGLILAVYFAHYFAVHASKDLSRQDIISGLVMAGFLFFSALLIVIIAFRPGVSPLRRLFGVALDAGTITFTCFSLPEYAAPLYCVYLWIIFGHGFRFGRPYLFFALALSFVGFGYVVFTLPYWQVNRGMGVGLWIGMLLVSLYISTLVKRLTTALAEAEVAKQNLTGALKSADEANHAKRRFLSTVSHEMRTPLNAIIGMGNLLQSTKLDAEQGQMVRTLDTASRIMLSLIEGVLDFSKIEAGKITIERAEFDLHQLVNNTLDIFKHQLEERSLSLAVIIEDDVPAAVIGDPYHLRQVLVNLLANAVKFTERGGIKLRMTAMTNEAQSILLHVEVCDSGIGIAPESQKRIFESFVQADESTTRRYGGTGLGTAICKQLVELMGGTIGVRSTLGLGSTFWFELPLEKQQPRAASTSNVFSLNRAQPAAPAAARRRNLSVLVADDNSINQEVMTRILRREGYTCTLAANGEEALDLLTAEDFDVIVLDMNMPVMNGIEAAKAYRFMTPEFRRAPIVMFSADVSKEVIDQCEAAGVDRFLPKPIDVPQFFATINELADKFSAKINKPAISAPVTARPPVPGEAVLNSVTLEELRALGEDDTFVAKMVNSFKVDSAKTMSRLDDALLRHRTEELRDLLHALKGASISIGANALRHLCHTLEQKSRNELIAGGLAGLEPLKKMHADTCAALDEYLLDYSKQRPH